MIPTCSSHASLPSNCSGTTCLSYPARTMSYSSRASSMRSYASFSSSGHGRQPASCPSNGALHDWMVTSNPYHGTTSYKGVSSTRTRRGGSNSRTRKVSYVEEYQEGIRIDTILAPVLFVVMVAVIKSLGRLML